MHTHTLTRISVVVVVVVVGGGARLLRRDGVCARHPLYKTEWRNAERTFRRIFIVRWGCVVFHDFIQFLLIVSVLYKFDILCKFKIFSVFLLNIRLNYNWLLINSFSFLLLLLFAFLVFLKLYLPKKCQPLTSNKCNPYPELINIER